jgi:hypothetical protein
VREAILMASAASWYLVGLGVTVGTTIYPSFALVGDDEWPGFHRHHSDRISWAVGAAWVAQAVGIVWWFLSGAQLAAWWVTGVTAFTAVALTVAVAVHLHNQLGTARSTAVLRRLHLVHAVRTLLWLISALTSTIALG